MYRQKNTQPVGLRYDPASPLVNYLQPVKEIEF